MKLAFDFHRIARDALRGRWMLAVIAGLIASLLGRLHGEGFRVNLIFQGAQTELALSYGENTFASVSLDGVRMVFPPMFATLSAIFLVIGILLAVLYFVLGSVIAIGYARFNLGLVDSREKPGIETLFSFFRNWQSAALMALLRNVFVFLWSLLLVIPGIMKAYSYRAANYILAEAPELPASEVLARSQELMQGSRWRLFCLDFSFIGWAFLAALTLGVGNLWLTPYREAAYAAFYRDLTRTAGRREDRYEQW